MKIVRNILAVIIGWFIGSMVNLSLIELGYDFYPIEGVDTNNFEALAAAMPELSRGHFLFPFLAHAFGTLLGATFAGVIAATHKVKFSWSIGFLFLIGGIMMSFMLPAPTWFIVIDLVLAYLPMAWIGGVLAKKIRLQK